MCKPSTNGYEMVHWGREKNWNWILMPFSFSQRLKAVMVECNWMITHLIRQMSNKIQFGSNNNDNAKKKKERMDGKGKFVQLLVAPGDNFATKAEKSGRNRFVSEGKIQIFRNFIWFRSGDCKWRWLVDFAHKFRCKKSIPKHRLKQIRIHRLNVLHFPPFNE